MRRNYVFCLVVVCITILILVWMVRGSLCELHIRQGNTELSAYLATKLNNVKSIGGEKSPPSLM